MKNSEKPAHPVRYDWDDSQKKVFTTTEKQGLTKREYFAAMALQGLLANPELYKIVSGRDYDAIDIYTKASIEHADDLLKQLES